MEQAIAQIQNKLSTANRRSAEGKAQVQALQGEKDSLAQQQESMGQRLADQARSLSKLERRLRHWQKKFEAVTTAMAATDAALRDAKALNSRLQEMGQVHAEQALSDLQGLCQVVGEMLRGSLLRSMQVKCRPQHANCSPCSTKKQRRHTPAADGIKTSLMRVNSTFRTYGAC